MKLTFFALLYLIFIPVTHAGDMEMEPEDAIKYRQAVMTAIKGHNSAIKSIVSGKAPFTKQLGSHVDAMASLFTEIKHIFPEGSDFGKTNAKDEIWDNPEKFNTTVNKATDAMTVFKKVVAQGDMQKTMQAYKKFGKATCGTCHKTFKQKQKR